MHLARGVTALPLHRQKNYRHSPQKAPVPLFWPFSFPETPIKGTQCLWMIPCRMVRAVLASSTLESVYFRSIDGGALPKVIGPHEFRPGSESQYYDRFRGVSRDTRSSIALISVRGAATLSHESLPKEFEFEFTLPPPSAALLLFLLSSQLLLAARSLHTPEFHLACLLHQYLPSNSELS